VNVYETDQSGLEREELFVEKKKKRHISVRILFVNKYPKDFLTNFLVF
jgi:hypothetical protein